MTHDEFLKAAASESLTAEQRQILREHAESCAECGAAAEPDVSRGWRFTQWWLAIAAVLFLALWVWREAGIRVARERIRSERAEIVELRNATEVFEQQKAKLAEDMVLISSPGVRMIQLGGQQQAYGKLYIDPGSHRGVLIATALPASGSANDYHLWLYGAGSPTPHSGATFDAATGHTPVSIADVPTDLKSVSVTLESGSGATQPGPNVVLSGAVQ